MGALDLPRDITLQRHRLTVEAYMRMGEAGIIAPDARTELIEGEVLDMAPIGTRHASTVKRLAKALGAAGDDALVAVQDPVHLGRRSMPQPDVMLLKPREDFYGAAHPVAADVLLLVEVADSTARLDREIKLPLYARHGVAEVWVVDLDRGVLVVCRGPKADGTWRELSESPHPGRVSVAAMPALLVDFDPIFKPAQS
jgi:Uma2 family endonuclease